MNKSNDWTTFWEAAKIKTSSKDFQLISEIMFLVCRLSLTGKYRLAKILEIILSD